MSLHENEIAGSTNAAVPPVPAAGTVPVPANEVFAIVSEYIEAGRLDAAERMLGHILAIAPRQPEALHTKGLIAFRRGRIPEASALMEQSLAGGAARATHWRNISEVYRLQVRLDEALTAGRRAISLDPADPLGPFNLAMILYDRLEIDACRAAARHSLELRANLPQSHMKLGQASLLIGDFKLGWDEYEWRYQIPGAQPLMPKTDRPQWDGRPLGQERLLLIGDQGYGDVVMFARYVPWALERCPNVVLACSAEMLPVLGRMFPGVPMFNRWDQIPAYAAFCPLSGLPRLHGTVLETIPAPIPYMRALPERIAAWKDRLDARIAPGMKRVAIAWSGRPTHNNNINRTITLDQLAPVTALPGITFLSVQKGEAVEQIARYAGAAPLLNLDAEIADFDDTMAIFENVDLVLCVDTGVGHFAGAMGRPVWVMIPYAPDWRWLLGRSDTPWYPAMRLFRHAQPRRWDLLMPQVAAALTAWAQGGG